MEVGKPELPVVRGLLGYPIDKSADSVELVSATWEHFYNYLIYPHQPGFPMEGPRPPFNWDQIFYNQDVWYPDDGAILSNEGVLRDIMVVNNNVQSFQYDPYQMHLRVSKEMVIDIDYSFSEKGKFGGKDGGSSGASPDFIPLYRSCVWNYDSLHKPIQYPDHDYLIITANGYYDYMEWLKYYLEGLGHHVILAKLDQIPNGYTALGIYHFIKDVYNTNHIVYILLAGDVQDNFGTELFNPLYMVPFPYWLPSYYDDQDNPEYVRPSDVCYACLGYDDPPPGYPLSHDNPNWNFWWTNHDWYPDVFVGRLTADYVDQVNHMIDKLWEYEHLNDFKTDNSLSPWYDTMLFVACKYHNPPHDDHSYFTDKERIKESLYHINLPQNIEVLCSDNVTQNANNYYVMKFIESGCFIVNYWGHGDYLSWKEWTNIPDSLGYKSFLYDPHVKNLNNENLVVVFNMGCNTADIDIPYGEDEYKGESLCCRWLKENRGGIAAIGATRRMWLYGTFYEAHDQNLFYVMYGVPEDNIFDWEPRNDISVVHYGAIERTFATNYEQPYNKIQYILPSDYIYILIGEPSMKIRNKWTEEHKISMNRPEKLLKEQAPEVTIYPNPSSSGIFTLKYKGSPSLLNNIEIYDISGRLVKNVNITKENTDTVNINDNTTEKELQLDLKDLSNGIYILSVDKEVYKNILICR
jgi:hypothetical protein